MHEVCSQFANDPIIIVYDLRCGCVSFVDSPDCRAESPSRICVAAEYVESIMARYNTIEYESLFLSEPRCIGAVRSERKCYAYALAQSCSALAFRAQPGH